MREKKKLELINNYVDIYKILFACKVNIFEGADIKNSSASFKLLQEVSMLKSGYEKLFEKLHLDDEAYLNLKHKLESSLKTHKITPNFTFDYEKYELKKVKITSDLYKTRLKYNI